MGTFIGHAFPGSVVVTMGLWWTFNIFYDFYKSQSTGQPYTARVSYSCPCERGQRAPCVRIPFEALMKIIFLIGGIYTEINPGLHIPMAIHGVTIYHVTIYSVFLLVPLVDILLRCDVTLPPMIDHVVLGLASLVDFLILYYHVLPEWNPLHKILHHLLAYTIAAIVVTIFAEILYRNSFLVSFARAYFICLYGTWYWQMAFVMYKPGSSWDINDGSSMVPLIVTYFGGHMAVNFVILILIGWVIRRVVVRCYGQYKLGDLEENMELLPGN